MIVSYLSILVVMVAARRVLSEQPTLVDQGVHQERNITNCTMMKTEVIQVQHGWPFSVQCVIPPSSGHRVVSQCMLSHAKSEYVVVNHTEVPTFYFKKANQSFDMLMTVLDEKMSCSVKELRIQVVKRQNPTSCEQVNNTVAKEVIVGDAIKLKCQLPNGMTVENGKMQITWLFNCSENRTTTFPTNSHDLMIPAATRDHAGVYTCAVKYNGDIQYLSKYRLCVRARSPLAVTSFFCANTKVRSKVGSNVTLRCSFKVGRDVHDPSVAQIVWTKVSSGSLPITTCSTNLPSQRNHSETSSAVSCQASTNVSACHSSPFLKKISNDPMVIDVDLVFGNVKQKDYGDYNVEIQFPGGINLIAAVALQRYQSAELNSMMTNCANIPSVAYDAFMGWPFVISCNDLTSSTARSDVGEDTECIVVDVENGQIVLNETQARSKSFLPKFSYTDILRTDSSKNYVTVTKLGSQCWVRQVNLNVEVFREKSCKTATTSSSMWENLCFGNKSLANNFGLEVSWLQNCLLPVLSNFETPLSREATDEKPEYTCAVTHDGMQTFAGKYNFCDNEKINLPLLECDSHVLLVEEGKPAQIKCVLTMERSSRSDWQTSWNKNNVSSADVCRHSDLPHVGTGYQDNVTCSSVALSTCVMYNAAKDGFLAVDQRIMTLSIPSIKEKDFGSYQLQLKSSSDEAVKLTRSVVLKNAKLKLKKINAECVLKPMITLNAYIDWPFTLRCDVLDEAIYNSFWDSTYTGAGYYYDYPEITPVECSIWKNRTGELLTYKTSMLDNLSELHLDMPDIGIGTPRHFLVVVNSSSSCWTQPIFVNATSLPRQTCEEAIDSAANKHIYSLTMGRQYKFLCSGQQPHLHDGMYASNFDVKWLRNCSVVGNESYEITSETSKPTLHLDNVTYEHPGVYSCAVTHNGQTQYLTHYPVCVKQPQPFSRVLVKCTKSVVYAKVGYSVTLECKGDVGSYNLRPKFVLWKKMKSNNRTSLQCAIGLSSETTKLKNGNTSCKASGIPEVPCHSHVPQGVERNPTTTQFQTSLTLTNIQEEDFGRYVVMLSWTSTNTTGRVFSSATVDLVQETMDISTAACEHKPAMILDAYIDWPFTLRCDVLETEMYDETESDYDDYFPENKPVKCTIWQNGTNEVLFDKTGTVDDLMFFNLDMPDVGKSTPRRFLIVVKSSSSCWTQPVYVNATKLPEQTCEEALNNMYRKRAYPVNIGKTLSLECTGEDSYLHEGSYTSTFNVTWLRNCTAIGNKSYRKMGYSNSPRMHITSITYEHPGVYTCAVTHNGQTQFVAQYPVCVKQASSFSRVLVKCQKSVVSAKVGSRISINCTGDLGYNDIPHFMASVRWMKIDANNSVSLQCFKSLHSKSARHIAGNVSCNATMVQLPCFSHVPQGNERNQMTVKLQTSITFEDVHEHDFGRYIVLISTGRSPKSKGVYPNATVQLTKAENVFTEKHSTHTQVIASCVAVVGLLVIAAVGFVTYHRCKSMKPVVKYTNHQFVHMELKNQNSVRSKA